VGMITGRRRNSKPSLQERRLRNARYVSMCICFIPIRSVQIIICGGHLFTTERERTPLNMFVVTGGKNQMSVVLPIISDTHPSFIHTNIFSHIGTT